LDPLANPNPAAVGALAAELLCGSDRWMRRRKLRVDFIDDTALRLRLSVDFCIPDGAAETAVARDGEKFVHLPLFVLRKAPQELLDFDLTDAGGRSVSLPTRLSNAEVSRCALEACAERVLKGPLNEPGLPDLIAHVAESDPPESLDRLDQLLAPDDLVAPHPQRSELAADDNFQFLARLVAWSSIIALPVPLRAGEQIFKLAFTEPLNQWQNAFALAIRAGLRPLSMLVDIPFVGAQSFHLEAHPPSGMSIGEGYLFAQTPTGPVHQQADTGGHALHVYLSGLSRGREGGAFLRIRARSAPFISNARNACAAVAAVLILSVVFAHQLAAANTTVPTLILFLPGLLATIASQPFEHPLAGRLLQLVRGSVILCAALAYLAAGWLLVAPARSATPPRVAVKVSETVHVHKTIVVRKGHAGQGKKAGATGGPPAVPNVTTAKAAQHRKVEGARRSFIGPASSEEHPIAKWLRIGWAILAIPALAAAILVEAARGRATP
jgi:hypothetical protein